MKVDPARHRERPWRVHTLAPDFELLDIWSVPIEADPARGETFDRFFDIVWESVIQPFRLWFVYPAWTAHVARLWRDHRAARESML